MKIIALDTTSSLGSIALFQNEKILSEVSWENASSHTAILPLQFKKILEQTDTQLDEIDLYAVAKGPGSFTGIRIGLAFVKGLTLLNEKPVLGISTLEAMAWAQDQQGLICPVLDARRSQVFGALFDKSQDLEMLVPEQAEDPSSFFQKVFELSEKRGSSPLLWGDGVKKYKHLLDEVFLSNPLKIEAKISIPLAASLARRALFLVLNKDPILTSIELTPHYLRGSAADDFLK